MYLAKTIAYSPRAEDMAKKIEGLANVMFAEGYELVTFSVTGSAKAVVVFRKKENKE